MTTECHDKPIEDERTAAYHAGRLLNRFRFHYAQANLLFAGELHEASQAELQLALESLKDFGATASIIGTVNQGQLHSTIAETRDQINAEFASDAHDAFLEEFNNYLDAHGDDYPLNQWRGSLIEKCNDLYKNVRESVFSMFGQSLSPALCLGEHLDAGIRPFDIHLRMFDAGRAAKSPPQGNLFANHVPTSENMPPNEQWWAQLRWWFSQSVPAEPAGWSALNQECDGSEIVERISCIDQFIRDAIRTVALPLVIVDDPSGPYALLYGKPLPLKNQATVIFLLELLAAKGGWVSSTTILQNRPDFEGGRIKRITSKLPKELRPLVVTERGKGSRLKLPAPVA